MSLQLILLTGLITYVLIRQSTLTNIIINQDQLACQLIMTTLKKNQFLGPKTLQRQTSRSKSRSSRNKSKQNKKKIGFNKNQNSFQSFKQAATKLPKKAQSKRITTTKNEEDQNNYYKYKEEDRELDKRSSLSQIYCLIVNLINKSETQNLTSTEKYMLSGYIDVFIKENYILNQPKDASTLTVEKLKSQWNKLCQAWQLYCIMRKKCQMGWQWQQKLEKADQNFEILHQQMSKINKSKQKLQPIRRLIKKFYQELVNF